MDWLVLAIVAVTLAAIMIRPRGISEAWVALAGGVAMLAIGAVAPGGLREIVLETSDVLLFLLGMMLVTGVVDRAGVFTALATWCVALARGNGIALYILMFTLGAIVTALLSLDVTVIMLTPIIYAMTRRHALDPIPFMFACTFVANTASLVFPFSNLTNLLLYGPLDLSFRAYAGTMWWPNLVAFLTNLLLFLWLFRRRIPRTLPAIIADETDPALPALPVAAHAWTRRAGALLGVVLVALVIAGMAGWPLWWAAGAGAMLLLIPAAATRRVTLAQMLEDVSPSIFVFVIGMTVLVRGVEDAWLAGITIPVPGSTGGMVAGGALAGAIGSNVINNVPMTVLARSVLEQVPVANQPVLAYAVLVGANIGPALTTYGSLATMLWLTLLRKRGVVVTTRQYLAVSLVTVPVVLAATSLTLWAVVR